MTDSPGGGAGGVDLGGVLSNLPEGTGPVATVIVVVLFFLASLIPVVARFIPDRPKKADAAPEPAAAIAASPRVDIDVLREHIARVERELAQAKEAQEELREKWQSEIERNRDLRRQLDAAEARVNRAQAELDALNAFLRPLQRDPRGQPPQAPWARFDQPSHPALRAPRAPQGEQHAPASDADDADTDPIPGARP